MDKDYVTTSDIDFAAYLMLNDFTFITCVDPEDGGKRYDFYLTHSDQDVRERIFENVNKMRDDFASIDRRFSEFHKYIKKLRSATYEPIRKSEWKS